MEGGLGIQVEFASEPDVELAFESLARSRQGIELLNLRRDGGVTLATVFVPEGKLPAFEKIIEDYLAERRATNGHSLYLPRYLPRQRFPPKIKPQSKQ